MDLYRELRLRILLLSESDLPLGIRVCVRVQEAIPNAAPDLVVVGMPD